MNHPIAEIFSQGEEVVSGQVADTNAAWLSQELVQMGFVMARHTAVGDKLQDLVALLKEISGRADFCICTGGLGPTVDDLTTEAVAQAFDCQLEFDPVALMQIERYFNNRKRVMADSNRKQAYFPKGAIRIDNAWGTAPGFSIQHNRCWFVFVPGVPTEMRHMFDEQIKPGLDQRFVLQADKLVVIKSIGLGESDLQQMFNQISLPGQVQLSFRATSDEVQSKLLFPAQMINDEVQGCINKVTEMMGDAVYAVYAVDQPNQPSIDLLSVIAQLMAKKNLTLSVFETATQGLIAAKCIGYDWLLESRYQQSVDLLTVNGQDDIEQMVVSIANSLKQTSNTDLLLVQLFQRDMKQFQDKQKSILLYNVLLTPSGTYQNTISVSGPIKRKQNQAAIRALDLLRRVLQNKCP